MGRRVFITGIGTGVGKTLVTTILCHQLRAASQDVRALKPVVSGFDDRDPESDPALILRSLGVDPSPERIATISPWRFAAPLSPHEAARREERRVTVDEIRGFCERPADRPRTASIVLIEGAGGVMSPIAEDGTCLDLMSRIGASVLLVAGTYLGAISHTLTAISALESRHVAIDAVVVSESSESVGLAATVEALRHYGSRRLPILTLPRIAGSPEDRWRSAPPLMEVIPEFDHD